MACARTVDDAQVVEVLLQARCDADLPDKLGQTAPGSAKCALYNRVYIGIILGFYWGDIGIMENKIETTIV